MLFVSYHHTPSTRRRPLSRSHAPPRHATRLLVLMSSTTPGHQPIIAEQRSAHVYYALWNVERTAELALELVFGGLAYAQSKALVWLLVRCICIYKCSKCFLLFESEGNEEELRTICGVEGRGHRLEGGDERKKTKRLYAGGLWWDVVWCAENRVLTCTMTRTSSLSGGG